jgi:hypothetical protein
MRSGPLTEGGCIFQGASVLLASACLLQACGGSTEAVNQDVCRSGTRWVGGDSASAEMNPGRPCLDCHARYDGPRFAAGGTVYADRKQEDNCFGLQDVEVQITDATGKLFSTKANAAGNFYFDASIAMPYRAAIVYQGMLQRMVTPQTNGDCNSCHTKTGFQGTSGRIYPPVAASP